MSGQQTLSDVLAQLESIRAKHGDLPTVLYAYPFAEVYDPDIKMVETDWTYAGDKGPVRKVVMLNASDM